jgi:hypothetical protein
MAKGRRTNNTMAKEEEQTTQWLKEEEQTPQCTIYTHGIIILYASTCTCN